jgi:putative SOS response-associated peptidase YedK
VRSALAHFLKPCGLPAIAASDVLKPFDARLMRCYPVSTHVKNVANDDEACSKPVELVRFRIGSSHKR